MLTRLELSASYPTKLNIERKIRSFREQDPSIVIHKFSDRSGSGNRLLRSLCNRTKMTKFQARDRQNRTKTINAFPAYGAMAAFRVPALRLQPQPALVIDRTARALGISLSMGQVLYMACPASCLTDRSSKFPISSFAVLEDEPGCRRHVRGRISSRYNCALRFHESAVTLFGPCATRLALCLILRRPMIASRRPVASFHKHLDEPGVALNAGHAVCQKPTIDSPAWSSVNALVYT